GRAASCGAPRAVTRSGEHQVGDQEADEDAGGHPQYGGQTGRPLSGPVALIGVGGIQERRDNGGDADHGQSSWPVDVHDRYHSPWMWWVRASHGWDTPVPPRPSAHARPEQGGGTRERPRLGRAGQTVSQHPGTMLGRSWDVPGASQAWDGRSVLAGTPPVRHRASRTSVGTWTSPSWIPAATRSRSSRRYPRRFGESVP